jgi:hypothetical protein
MGIEYKWNEQLNNFVDIKPWMRPMRRCFLPMTIQYISCVFSHKKGRLIRIVFFLMGISVRYKKWCPRVGP